MESNNSKHTQGNWKVMPIVHGASHSIVSNREFASTLIAKVGHDDISDEEAEANAKLIASAPMLLQALEAVLNNVDGNGNISLSANGKVIAEIKAAIEKATT